MQYTSAQVLANIRHHDQDENGENKFGNRRAQSLSNIYLGNGTDSIEQENVPFQVISKGSSNFHEDSGVLPDHGTPPGGTVDGGYAQLDRPQHSHYDMDRQWSQGNPMTVTWTDINVVMGGDGRRGVKGWMKTCCRKRKQYSKMDGKEIRILKNVSGVASPGRLLAIMGASGAGKTTLLNVLTQRNLGRLTVYGQVRINGAAVGTRIRKIAAYVQQDDMFIGILTVREHVMFHARLRLGKNVSEIERERRVDEVIIELGLSKCQNTQIAGGGIGRKGISGGERKRLAFATEILTNPAILLCDEPTSGLDSFMALQTVDVLQKMARQGKTILCTIHQPSSQVFEIFDDLCLLAHGRIAYMGPTKEAKLFFEMQEFPCPPKFNPADHYIRILAMTPGKEKLWKERIKKICRAYDRGPEKETVRQITSELMSEADRDKRNEIEQALASTGRYKSSWCQQARALLWRSWMENVREPMLIPVRFVQTIIISFLLGLVYYGTKLEGNMGIQNVTGLLFLFTSNMTFQYVFAVVDVFSAQLPVFMREHVSGVYRVDTYFIAKIITELPQYIIFPFVFTVILYFMAGLDPNAAVFFTLAGINILSANVAISFGYLISIIFADITIALSVTPAIIIPAMLFGGYYMNMGSVPDYFVWIHYLSYFKYSYEASVINQFSHIGYIPGCGKNFTCPSNGTAVLQSLSIDPDRFSFDILIMVLMIVVVRFLSYLTMLIRAYRKD